MFEPVFEHDETARGAVRGEGKPRGPRPERVLAGRFPRLAARVLRRGAGSREGRVRTVRRFSDEVHVRCDDADEGRETPVQFIWRGRLYVVREVLSRWRERSAWWEHAAVAAVHGDATTATDPTDPARHDTRPARRPVLEIGDLEREVVRVEASAGRAGTTGVYDLARAVAPGTAAVPTVVPGVVSEVAGTPSCRASGDWQLLRVSD